jgi:hypothetical protein
MRKSLQTFISQLFQLFYLRGVVLVASGATAMMLAGCDTLPKAPTVITQHIVVAPADNLLVNCEVTPPPAKATYVAATPGINPNISLQKDSAYYQALYVKKIKELEAREGQLSDLAMHQYQNLDACNKRLQQLREWKVTATQALNTQQKE